MFRPVAKFDTQDAARSFPSKIRGNQKLDLANKAMITAIGSGHAVPLFNKLAVNRWEFLGFWYVVDAEYIYDESRERMVWKFILSRQAIENPETADVCL